MIQDALHADGWTNLIAGIGKKTSDKTESTEFYQDYMLSDEELASLYDGEGLGANIVDIVADDMTRAGWTIEEDTDNKIVEEMTNLKAVHYINKALKYARLFGGAIIIVVTEKGKLSNPLSVNFGKIKKLRVYSAARINLSAVDIVNDPDSPYFEDVEFFNVQSRSEAPFKVHRSRCLWFGGEMCSDYGNIDLKYRYWGVSVIQRIWARLKHYGSIERAVANLMLEYNIGKYTFSNLAQILAMNSQEALDILYTRLEAINLTKSMINGVLLGEGEAYERDSASINGVADIIDRFQLNLCSVAKIPVTKLFRRSPAGMNATGDSDLQLYYDDIKPKQENELLPELQKLVNWIGSYVHAGNKKHKVSFNSLWEPTEKEKAEVKNMNAETCALNVQQQIISEEESRTMQYPELPEWGIDESKSKSKIPPEEGEE